MKLKALFILPLIIFSALCWAPLTMASNPVGGGNLQTDNSEKNQQISDLEKEIASMQNEVNQLQNKATDADNELSLKGNELSQATSKEQQYCATNPDGAAKFPQLCYQAIKDADAAGQASATAVASKKAADDALKTAQDALKAKQAELDALKKQPNSGANDQGISNYSKGGTILPDTAYQQISDCEAIMRYVNNHPEEIKKAISERQAEISGPSSPNFDYTPSYTDIMGCAIKTGDIKFWMVPYFVRYILEFIIGIAGLASVAGIVYGGYFYLFAGLSDDQQKGKNAIKNSIIALVLSLSAWAIVNIVISLVTSI